VFFVRAEDGIRVFHVTGVQTCALPILTSAGWAMGVGSVSICRLSYESIRGVSDDTVMFALGRAPCASGWLLVVVTVVLVAGLARSEERRVGKGGGARASRAERQTMVRV